MQRDMELVRSILLAVEKHEHGKAPSELAIDGYSAEQVGYHCHLIGQAGLADVADLTTRGSASPVGRILRLTWQGHEFLDAARDDTVWSRTKERLTSAGKSLLTVPLNVLTALLADEGKRQLGLAP